MKKLLIFFCANALIGAFGTACHDAGNDKLGRGLGEEIPGMEIKQATGTVIGRFADTGFGSFLIQVEEEYPIGKTFEFYDDRWVPATMQEGYGTYSNMIQVQHKLPVEIGDRISFSAREFQNDKDKDRDLFLIGEGTVKADHVSPQVPAYIVTKYKILNTNPSKTNPL